MEGDELTLRQARELCLRFGDLYRTRREWAIKCFDAGMSRTEIAHKTGLARQTISEWVNSHRLREELARAADEIDPSPGGLDIIQSRIIKRAAALQQEINDLGACPPG